MRRLRPAGAEALQDVSWTAPPGTTTAIVGHTGSGKTTVGRLLFRFYDVHRGTVLLHGQPLAELTQRSSEGGREGGQAGGPVMMVAVVAVVPGGAGKASAAAAREATSACLTLR